MVFDSAHGGIVLFGGTPDGNIFLGDTWRWDGEWHELDPDDAPPPRFGVEMEYDVAAQVGVLFGGWDGAKRADTWLWSGATWNQPW
jgi:hypothetical protein